MVDGMSKNFFIFNKYNQYLDLPYDEKKMESVKTIQIFDIKRMKCTFMNSLEDFVFRSVTFSAPIDLIDKLKEHQI